jgi:uncharacterized protein YbaP (TraB family)
MRILFVLFLFISWVGKSQIYEPENALLWEISGNGMKEKSYLFGTFHNNHKDLFRFSDTVYFALDKVKSVALETDLFALFKKMDVREDMVELQLDMYGDPYSTSKKASKTVYGDEDGMPQFMDAYFQQYATNSQKELFFFESYDDQIKVFTGINKSKQPFLQENLLGFGELREEVIFNLYQKGNIEKIEEFTRKSLKYSKDGYVNLIVTRNGIMAEGLDSIVKTTSVFCAIGAAHLGGNKGVINLLRQKGYTVRKVAATYNELPITEKRKVKEKNYYNYQNQKLDVAAVFPGKPFEFVNDDGSIELTYCELGQGNTYVLQLIPIQDTLSLEEYANIHIASPSVLEPTKVQLDDGTLVMEGLSDSYPEGMSWVRVNKNNSLVVVMKVYGGNKFMASKRYKNFFAKVWLGQD